MNRIPVKSSSIASIGHENDILEVAFKSGSVYQYTNVPRPIYHELMAAESKGRYFYKRIRDKYPCKKIENIK